VSDASVQQLTALRTVGYDERFLDASWRWLQDDELRSMVMAGPMTREGQRAWYERLPARTDYRIWGVELDGEPVAVFGIKGIADGSGEYFAFIGEPQHWGRGIGGFITDEVIRLGRELGLSRLWGVAKADNQRTLRRQARHGFREYRREDGLVWIERGL
jgi:RimJ/RimL family protein N-acetyltransferase